MPVYILGSVFSIPTKDIVSKMTYMYFCSVGRKNNFTRALSAFRS